MTDNFQEAVDSLKVAALLAKKVGTRDAETRTEIREWLDDAEIYIRRARGEIDFAEEHERRMRGTDKPGPTGEGSLFEGTLDAQDAALRRKQAAADPDRFAALVYAYEHRDEEPISTDALPADNDDITPLLEENLLAGHPLPDGAWAVRITTLGELELPIDGRTSRDERGPEGSR